MGFFRTSNQISSSLTRFLKIFGDPIRPKTYFLNFSLKKQYFLLTEYPIEPKILIPKNLISGFVRIECGSRFSRSVIFEYPKNRSDNPIKLLYSYLY